MRVLKRDNTHEEVAFDKISARLRKLTGGKLPHVDLAKITSLVVTNMHDGISTSKIDELAADACVSLLTEHPEYGTLGARILVSNWHKNTSDSVLDTYEQLASVLSEEFMDTVRTHAADFQAMIDYKRDYDFDFFAIKTLEKIYCGRVDGVLVERPQHMYLRVAIALHGTDLKKVKETYTLMSKKKFTHASPTLFNAGLKVQQMSSCYLHHCGDSLAEICDSWRDIASISKLGGGIGVHVHHVRSKGAPIISTNGTSDGLIPMLRVMNSVVSYVNQCFVPETPVYSLNKGVVRMDQVGEGDRLLTKDGTFKRVNEVFTRAVESEPMITFVPEGGLEGITCTKVHDIFCMRDDDDTPGFRPAGELKVGDRVGFPIPTEDDVVDLPYFSEELCRFYGIMLGESGLMGKPYEYGLLLDETTQMDTLDFVETLFEKHDIQWWTGKNKTIHSFRWASSDYLGHSPMLGIEYDMVWDDAMEKRMDPRFLNLPRAKSLALLKGLLESTPGSNEGEGDEFRFSGSKALVMAVRYLCLRLGMLTRVDTSMHNVLRIPKAPIAQESGSMLYMPIVDIKHSSYTGEVYDFNMESNHNYTTDGGLVHNSGRRKGSMAVYLSPHHPDVMDFLELRRPGGDDMLRTRDLFLAMWIPDLFMKRVETDGEWSFFDPFLTPGLDDVYGDAYEALFEQYETEGKARKTVKARDVWNAILRSQMETGTPYMLYKDACNAKSNQKNLGTIKCSNLCVAPETMVLTKEGYVRIEDVKDKEVEVWNGIEWSTTTVRQTNESSELLRILFSNGCSLECTPYHTFYLQPGCEKKEAQDLVVGDTLIPWKLPGVDPPASKSVQVLRVERTGRVDRTFCFTEPKRGMGVFNGVLTGNCSEIVEYTSPDETSVCNLASISLPAFVKADGTFDFAELLKVAKVVAKNLDRVIDINVYPIPQAKTSNLRHRPIGIGAQGLADVFVLSKVPFDSAEARALNTKIFATMYYAAIEASTELAADHGPYESYKDSPASQGLLQYDLWNVDPHPDYDWGALKRKLSKHGLRNSLSIAIMPTASTAQVFGNNESVEPFTSLLYTRRTLAGEFVVVNKYLVDDLVRLELWSDDLTNEIISKNGSIQTIPSIPQEIKDLYKTAWDLSQKSLIDQAADRGPYVCQSQSLNLFVGEPTFPKLTSMHFYAWRRGLKTGMYYLRSKPASSAKKITLSSSSASLPSDTTTDCLMCSS